VKVLVVDDTEAMRFLITRWLGGLGHEAVAIGAALDVGGHLEAGGFDVVLTDVAMPDASGWDVLTLVRSRWPALPVVLMTGWADAAPRADGLAPDAVLEKPFTRERVGEVLEALARTH
jgi:CheY-like chemotaxis protein